MTLLILIYKLFAWLRDLLYPLEYSIKLVLWHYGDQYSVYPLEPIPEGHEWYGWGQYVDINPPAWPWYKYLGYVLCDPWIDLVDPTPLTVFSSYEDAVEFVGKYPELRLTIRRERYIP